MYKYIISIIKLITFGKTIKSLTPFNVSFALSRNNFAFLLFYSNFSHSRSRTSCILFVPIAASFEGINLLYPEDCSFFSALLPEVPSSSSFGKTQKRRYVSYPLPLLPPPPPPPAPPPPLLPVKPLFLFLPFLSVTMTDINPSRWPLLVLSPPILSPPGTRD